MLAGFLTRALEILIILDICGAVVYFALSGLLHAKRPQPHSPLPSFRPAYASGLQACPVGAVPASLPPPPVHPDDAAVYAGYRPSSQAPEPSGFAAGLKRCFGSLRHRLSRGTPSQALPIERPNMEEEHRRLGQVLESFREEA